MSATNESSILEAIKEDNNEFLSGLKDLANQKVNIPGISSQTEYLPILHACAAFNAFDCTVYLIQNGFDFNASDSQTLLPIHYAAEYGSAEVLTYLLKLYKEKDMLKSLFDQEKKFGESSTKFLYRAASLGVLEIYKLFSDYGFDYSDLAKHNKDLFQEICKKLSYNPSNDPETIIFFLNRIENIDDISNNQKSPLITAVIHALDDRIISMLTKHCDINKPDEDNKTAFEYAYQQGNGKAARILINKEIGPSINNKTFFGLCKLRDPYVTKVAFDKYGDKLRPYFYEKVDNTYPLSEALLEKNENNFIEFLKILIENGFDPMAQSNPQHPTIYELFLCGIAPGRTKILKFLIDSRYDLNTMVTSKSKTAKEIIRTSYNKELRRFKEMYPEIFNQ